MHGKLDRICNPAGTKLGLQSSIYCPWYSLPAHLHILMENTNVKIVHELCKKKILHVVSNVTKSRSNWNVILILGNKDGRVQSTNTADWLVGAETFFDPLLYMSLAKLVDLDNWYKTQNFEHVRIIYISYQKLENQSTPSNPLDSSMAVTSLLLSSS